MFIKKQIKIWNLLWQRMNEDMRKLDWFFLIMIVISAVLFRLLFLTRAYSVGFDEVNYLKLAASGKINGINHILHPYWSPFYPFAVTLFSYLIPDFEYAGRLVSILCASFVIFPLFFFLKTNFNKRIAFGTSLLIAYFSFSAYFSIKAEAEFVYSIVSICGILLGWSVLKYKQFSKSFIVGLLFGLAYLSRPEGIGFLITFWVIVFIVVVFQLFSRKEFHSYINILLLSGIGFGIVSLPYIFYLHRTTGIWTISAKGASNQQGELYEMYYKEKGGYQGNPFHTLSEDNTRLLVDEIYHLGNYVKNQQQDSRPVVRITPKGLAVKIAKNYNELFREGLTKVFPIPLMFLLGLGLFAHTWAREESFLNLYLLSYLIFFWFLLIPVFHVTLRYFVPMLPIALIWIVKGGDYFITWFSNTIQNIFEILLSDVWIRTIGTLLVVLGILFSSIVPDFGKRIARSKYSTELWAPCIEQKKAGLWLKKNGVKSPVIMAYNHAVSFYAENYNIKESVDIPENKIYRILQYAKYRGVKYLVLNNRYREKNPLIGHLYEQKDVPQNLKIIYFDEEKNGLKTWIYEIL